MEASLLSVLIPLYNEEEFIQEVLERVLAAPLPEGLGREIIVVDDCSRDASAEIVENFIASCPGVPVRLIRHDRNRGKGAAIRTRMRISNTIRASTRDCCIRCWKVVRTSSSDPAF